MLFSILLTPQTASANIFDFFTHTAQADVATNTQNETNTNSQKMALAESNIGPNSTDSSDSSILDIIVNNTVLAPKVGPLGSSLDVADIPENAGQINVYTVHSGDTISSVAQMFNVSKSTITSANDLSNNQTLKEGMVLAIPPVSGRIHNVKNGDTITSISKKYKVKDIDIAVYNDLEINSDLTPGDTLIIPDSNFNDTTTENPTPKPTKNTKNAKNSPIINQDKSNSGPITAHPMRVNIKVDLGNALLRPVSINVSRRSQGAHGIYGSAVDLAAPIGTPIMASADGVVVLAKSEGFNGGYGKYVIIMSNIDGNVVQTIYGHMSQVLAITGMQVHRGDLIGKVGQTGRATGPHVHFEVHGALNPLTLDSNYTGE